MEEMLQDKSVCKKVTKEAPKKGRTLFDFGYCIL